MARPLDPALYFNLSADFRTDMPPIDWKAPSLPGRLVRVIYDDDKKLPEALRRVCSLDCEVEVLNVDKIQYGFVMYDTSAARKALAKIGRKAMPPWIYWVSRSWALEMIGALS